MSKGSDKNVGSIEEDIKQLEYLLILYRDDTKGFIGRYPTVEEIYDKDFIAIEKLLQDYTRQKQINEEHRKENAELICEIKELEEMNEIKKIGIIAKDREIKALKEKVKELEDYIFIAPNLDEMTATKYLNIQREAYIRGKADEQQKTEQIIYQNYIPKQKIKDKIEELNKKYEDSKDENGESPYFYPSLTIKILQKLLQENEDK